MQAVQRKDAKGPRRKVKQSAVQPKNEGIEMVPSSSKSEEGRGDAASVSTVLSAKEAWSKDGDGQQMMVVKRSSRPGSAATVLSQENELPKLREERNVYIPYLYARNCIARIEDHMQEMHADHINVVANIQTVYKDIENDSSLQFKTFVFNLRDQYSTKLNTYREVIEALRRELRRKELYLEEINVSLAFRNQHLLAEQNQILEKYKEDLLNMEKEKNELELKLSELENKQPVVVTKETEIKIIQDELETEKQERQRLAAIVAAGAVGGAVIATSEDKEDVEALRSEIQALEEQNAELSALPDRIEHLEAQLAALLVVASVADKEKTQAEMEKLKSDEEILNEEKKKLEEDIEKWEKEFKKKNGRPPKESDRGESQKEIYTQLNETNNMLKATNAKSDTLRVIGSGGIPAIVPIPLPKVKSKTKVVKVRDHEIEAEVIRLRAELAAAKRGVKADPSVVVAPVPIPVEEKKAKKKKPKAEGEEEVEDEDDEEEEEDKDAIILRLKEQLQAQAIVGIDIDEDTVDLRPEIDRLEALLREEKMAHEATREELESLRAQNDALNAALEEAGSDAGEKVLQQGLQEEIARKEARIAELEAENDELKQAGVEQLPEKIQEDYKKMKLELAAARKAVDETKREETTTKAKIASTGTKATALERTVAAQKKTISDLEKKLAATKEEAAASRKKLNEDWERKEARRAADAEKKISKLKAALAAATAAGAVKGARGSDEVVKLRKENAELTRQLAAASKSDGPSGGISAAEKRKMEKILNELDKKFEMTKAKLAKSEHLVKQLQDQVSEAKSIIDDKDKEIRALTAQLAALGANAKEGAEAMEKLKKFEKDNKRLQEELATVTENFNSERVLRKKYYNMVEDMKGKIRVYCRARPMSGAEKENGNTNVLKSPDEYTVAVKTSRGEKEFNFDTVFMPEHGQDKVFEDTYNLVQSAFDGYNVCIFAYGQTGSGKTYTMIGDRAQQNPGIAPRAFERIFDLLQENKNKFSITVSAYMLELYNDKLLDLFKNGAEFDDKLEIKKDKKGMVFVPGAEVKFTKSAKDLYSLFESGSKNRHTASTKMNEESSRSHLVIGVMIESTNKATGQVSKGKLSLVDLAGSERVAKTGATAQQLKEANSINKSLSALGDVISALSSDQQFIPYRNNKLTMLMQDSLGGNAKTLMFVNISPADYNADETVISLTYASRVKMITNDAQKNSDNKEIARLKSIIAKLKKGETVTEEDE